MATKYSAPDISKYEYQKSVLTKGTLTPPGSPTLGDRYLINGTGTGAWAGQDYNIATWDGTQWVFYAKRVGMMTWVKDESKYYTYTAVNTWTATAATHAQQHAITSTSDHTSSATPGKILKADANGLPVNASNTDTEVADAVTKKHTAGSEAVGGDLTGTAGAATVSTVGGASATNVADAVTKRHTAGSETLGGDLSGTAGAATVATVGGQSAANVAAAVTKAAVYNAGLETIEFTV